MIGYLVPFMVENGRLSEVEVHVPTQKSSLTAMLPWFRMTTVKLSTTR